MRSRFVALLLCAGLLGGASDPNPWFGRDKGLHFAATTLLSGGGYAAGAAITDQPWKRAAFAITTGLAAGFAKEGLDLAGYGDPSLRDLAWDLVGTFTGTVLAMLLDALLDAPRQPAEAR